MLVIAFSIAVETDRADEIREVLINDYGVQITKEYKYSEALCWYEPESRVYFDCFTPASRFELLTDYLNKFYDGTAILSY